MFTSRNNSFMEKPDPILAFPWDNVIQSFTNSSTSSVYRKKIVILNLSNLSSLVSNCSIFSMSLLLLIRFVYCTLVQSPTLANINSGLNSVSRSSLNPLTNNSTEILLIFVAERLDTCSVNWWFFYDFFDNSLEKVFTLLLNWRSLVHLMCPNVPNFFKTPLAAKPMSTEELGKKWAQSLNSRLISLASVCSCTTSVCINLVTRAKIGSFNSEFVENVHHSLAFSLNLRAT